LETKIGFSPSPRLDGVDLVEAAPPGGEADAEPLLWLAARADVVVCVLDSQQQPIGSDKLLQWIAKLHATAPAPRGPTLQFVASKADLLSREAERIRLIARAVRIISDHIGRGFEVLPVAAGNVDWLLDSVSEPCPVLTVCGKEFPAPMMKDTVAPHLKRVDEGMLRIVRAADAHAAEHAKKGLNAFTTDCEKIAQILSVREIMARRRHVACVVSLSMVTLITTLVIVCAATVFLREADETMAVVSEVILATIAVKVRQVEPLELYAAAVVIIGVFQLLLRWPLSKVDDHFKRQLARLIEQQHILELIDRQRVLWAGG